MIRSLLKHGRRFAAGILDKTAVGFQRLKVVGAYVFIASPAAFNASTLE